MAFHNGVLYLKFLICWTCVHIDVLWYCCMIVCIFAVCREVLVLNLHIDGLVQDSDISIANALIHGRLCCRLFVMLVVSAVVVVVAIFIPTGTGLVVLLAATGFLLSLNWSVLARRLVTSRLRGLFSWGWRSLLLYSLLLAAVCGISAGLAANQEAVRSAAPYLAYACLGLWPIQALLADVQRVYVMAGLCRNALYPASAQRAAKFKKRKQKLRVIGIIRRVLVSGGKLVCFTISVLVWIHHMCIAFPNQLWPCSSLHGSWSLVDLLQSVFIVIRFA